MTVFGMRALQPRLPLRMTCLAAICLTQAWMMWKFINFQLKKWREHSQNQATKKKAVSPKNKPHKREPTRGECSSSRRQLNPGRALSQTTALCLARRRHQRGGEVGRQNLAQGEESQNLVSPQEVGVGGGVRGGGGGAHLGRSTS